MLYEHQGWVSTSWTLIQVSNVVSPNVNGKSQLLHPVGISYCDQMARNPVRVLTLLVMNLRLTEFVVVMMENGVDISVEVPISPQYFSSSISNQSYLHVLPEISISKCRKVILILSPSSTLSIQVYNTNN